ncbi:hypothetical protein C922_05668 [Plasmodium inui San Antonio 1]|uniref:Uncharacterized protein n=1 Tax=Plasmodium inui San Antonio 1 TaxID=1237626 RepID=W6ZXA9_9APIC|nr:hypothetical protein C922_05668 [Plasmodium inui San Antonio 1]EUD63948.1 hypothetical protein C922_05668 [Plasmodium inui San Antonio 1]
MYHNPAHNLSLTESGHAVIATTHNSTGTARLRNTRLLLTHVQRHLKLVYALGSPFGRDYTYILKNKGNINSSCKEFLLEDFQKRSFTSTGDILDRRWPAHTIQELTNNEAIMCEGSTGGLSGDVKPPNSLLDDIGEIHIVMITNNMNILRRILQKIRYIEQSVLTTGISIIIEYHRELCLAVQETLSMRNRTLTNEVKNQAKYLLNFQGGIAENPYRTSRTERTNLSKYRSNQNRKSSASICRIRTIILKQYPAVINTVWDPIAYLYVLVEVSKYGQTFDGISKPRFKDCI